MDTLRAPTAFASLIAANLAPIVGILLFGWSFSMEISTARVRHRRPARRSPA